MKISKINNINFGKIPLMACLVKKQATKEKTGAMLYELDPKREKDRKEVMQSSQTAAIAPYFLQPNRKDAMCSKFYILKDEYNKEIISCAKTSKHYMELKSDTWGPVVVIDELNSNPSYINGIEPTVDYIAKRADSENVRAIISALRQEDVPDFNYKREKFTQNRLGDWVMPQKRFVDFTDAAQKRSEITYFDAEI